MVSAAVGFQCPECVRGARPQTRPQRTVLGGRASLSPGVLTLCLIGANLVVFLLVHTQSASFLDRMVYVGRFEPNPGSTQGAYGVAQGQWYRLISAEFTHQQLWHIFMNMFALYNVGTIMEHLLGRARFLALYLVCAVAATTTTYLFTAPGYASLGASGAIMGLFGAAVVIFRRLRYEVAPLTVSIILTLMMPWVISNVDWHAHLGGLVAGVAIGSAFAYAPQSRRTLVGVGTVCGLAGLVVVLVVVRTSMLT